MKTFKFWHFLITVSKQTPPKKPTGIEPSVITTEPIVLTQEQVRSFEQLLITGKAVA